MDLQSRAAQIQEWRLSIEHINDYGEDVLSEWEEGFISSITEQLDAGKLLSERQQATLTKIENKVREA